jgi:site-specific DNA-methyltransferase (adenine-specific)
VILRKILVFGEDSITSIMGGHNEFGLLTNFRGYRKTQSSASDINVYAAENGKRVARWMDIADLPKGHEYVDRWKVLIPTSYGERGAIPALVLGPLMVVAPPAASTQTYVFIPASSKGEADSIAAYARTRFFRFLMSLRKITQHATKTVYSWVPVQDWSEIWTDEKLAEKYDLTEDEIAFIESMIRPMENLNG